MAAIRRFHSLKVIFLTAYLEKLDFLDKHSEIDEEVFRFIFSSSSLFSTSR